VRDITWAIGLILAFIIFFLVPIRIARLYRRDLLTASNFALTFTVGWCLAILILFYFGLAEILLSKKDALLYALGLIIAAINFALGYPLARLFYEHVFQSMIKRLSRK
jgi:hypothetical protein